MRFLRVLCNILYCFAIMMTLSLVQVAIYDVVAAQSSDVEGIHITTSNEDQVAYFDSYTFWVTDISTAAKVEPKHRIRGWFNWQWWRSGMKWTDTALDTTIAVVKPLTVPIAQVNAVKEFYGKSINDYEKNILLKYNGDLEKANNAVYELYVIYGDEYSHGYAYIFDGEDGVKDGDKSIVDWEYTGSYKKAEDGSWAAVIKEKEYPVNDVSYSHWINLNSGNKALYNHNWKLLKYNYNDGNVYSSFFHKFVEENASGERDIKTAAVILYYHHYVSMIIAIIFVCKYPISFIQARVTGKRRREQDSI